MKAERTIVGLLCVLMIIGGCGTAATELASIGTPERVVSLIQTTATPDATLITVVENHSGTADRVSSTGAGAVEPLSTIKIYPVNQTTPVAMFEGTADANGEFDIAIGDDVLDTFILKATASNKEESAGIVLVNDVFK